MKTKTTKKNPCQPMSRAASTTWDKMGFPAGQPAGFPSVPKFVLGTEGCLGLSQRVPPLSLLFFTRRTTLIFMERMFSSSTHNLWILNWMNAFWCYFSPVLRHLTTVTTPMAQSIFPGSSNILDQLSVYAIEMGFQLTKPFIMIIIDDVNQSRQKMNMKWGTNLLLI